MVDQKIRWLKADYLWLDGASPTQQLRSKVRVIGHTGPVNLEIFEDWGFDGSSTYQATGHNSDLVLKPVRFYPDPARGEDYYLVMCEVLTADNQPHATNARAQLRSILETYGKDQDPWAGFEQEYTFFKENRPLGWPENGYPAPQGPFYCSTGAEVAFGREIVEEHLSRCLAAGLMIYGINAEVMPGQWEFQVGYRGVSSEDASVLKMADETWVARYLLSMVSEKYGVSVSYDVKPVKGDWNGAGMHTNFSTRLTRDPREGMKAIEEAIKRLSKCHDEHIAQYGANNHERLTGHHETCSIHEFRYGIADRGCSIRVPRSVAERGYGYFEDRRPGANADPYQVGLMLVRTVLGARS